MAVISISFTERMGDEPSRETWKLAEQLLKPVRLAVQKLTRTRYRAVTRCLV
jgi:hypothetical protein